MAKANLCDSEPKMKHFSVEHLLVPSLPENWIHRLSLRLLNLAILRVTYGGSSRDFLVDPTRSLDLMRRIGDGYGLAFDSDDFLSSRTLHGVGEDAEVDTICVHTMAIPLEIGDMKSPSLRIKTDGIDTFFYLHHKNGNYTFASAAGPATIIKPPTSLAILGNPQYVPATLNLSGHFYF